MSPVVRYHRQAEAERFVDFFQGFLGHAGIQWDSARMAFVSPVVGDILVVGETPQHEVAARISALAGGVHAAHVRKLRIADVGVR